MQFQTETKKRNRPNKNLYEIAKSVEKEWQYWRPIAYGIVKIDKEDYDREGPLFMMKINVAMNYRIKLEKEAIEKAKENSDSEQ